MILRIDCALEIRSRWTWLPTPPKLIGQSLRILPGHFHPRLGLQRQQEPEWEHPFPFRVALVVSLKPGEKLRRRSRILARGGNIKARHIHKPGLVGRIGFSFAQDLHAFEPMREALEPIIAKVWRQCQATGIQGRTVTLKVKFADFQQITRSKSFGEAIDSLADLERLSLGLLEPLLPPRKGVRLLGISLSSLTQAQATGRRQLSLVL
jgi:hypothetical protein